MYFFPGAVFNVIKDGEIIGTEATGADGTITVTDVTEGMYAFVEVSAPAPYATLRDTDNGHLSSKGLYTTDDHGEIHISGVTGTIVVKETRPLPGYTIEPGRESQTVTVNPQETQTLTFYNIPANTLTVHKYIDGTDNEPLAGVEFLVTDGTGAVVGPNNGYYTTDKDGRFSIPGLTPSTTITVKETKTKDGYILDSNPQTITIKEGEAQSLTFRNKKAGGLIINKVDALTKEPLAGVKFKITFTHEKSRSIIRAADCCGSQHIKILEIEGAKAFQLAGLLPGNSAFDTVSAAWGQ